MKHKSNRFPGFLTFFRSMDGGVGFVQPEEDFSRSPARNVTPPQPGILPHCRSVFQMMGRWYLLITASKCSYLMNHGSKVEPTVMTLARSSDQTLSVSTKTRQ